MGPAPIHHAAPATAPKPEKPKIEIEGPSGKIETHGEKAKISGPKKSEQHKKSDGGVEEVVGIAERVVAAAPEADATIFALEQPEGYVIPSHKEAYGGYEGGDRGYWGEGEGEEEGEDGEEEDEDEGYGYGYEEEEDGGKKEPYEPFLIKL